MGCIQNLLRLWRYGLQPIGAASSAFVGGAPERREHCLQIVADRLAPGTVAAWQSWREGFPATFSGSVGLEILAASRRRPCPIENPRCRNTMVSTPAAG